MDEDMEKGKDEPESADTPVKVKQEPKERADIKDFAETTMNELLGWYGYDKVVDHQDTENLDLHRFTGNTSGSGSRGSTPNSGGKERPSLQDSGSLDDASLDSLARSTPSTGGQSDLAASHKNLVTALTTAGEKGKGDGSTAVGEREAIVCQWCQKPGVKLFTLKTADGTKGFCSELCFTLCRRASFKKNKLCDWCKHVRHTVSFVDFQDGDQQLQFCSDKCLNQYKMNIFCKETQEHLQQIQTQVDASKISLPSGSSKQILITPDLWVNDQPGKETPKEKEAEKDKQAEPKARDTPSAEPPVPKPAHHLRSSLYDRHTTSRDESLQRSRAELTSPIASTSKSAHDNYERSIYPSERERLRRLKSRDSASSTPISLTASPSSSQISTPRCSTSNDVAKSVLNSTLSARASQAAAAAGSSSAATISSLSQSDSHLMYHPLLAAGLAGGLPGLLPQGVLPPLPLAGIPPPQPLPPPKESVSSETNPPASSSSQPTSSNATQAAPAGAGVFPPPPPLFNSTLWNPMAGVLPGLNPYSHFPGGYMPSMPNPFSNMMPPNTLMMPYPVVVPLPLPFPIPIPIPIPIKNPITPINIKPEPTTETISKTSSITNHLSPRHKSPVRVSSAGPRPDTSSVVDVESVTEPVQDGKKEHNEKNCENKPAGKIACACCQQTTTTETLRSVSRCSSDGGSVHASRSPHPSVYYPESQPPRLLNGNPPILVMPQPEEQNDVIDLSKDSKHSSISSPLSDVDHNKNSMPLSASPSSNGNDVVVAPNPVPLLPLATDPRYSARRSLILDAPSVPRDKNRSPSPGEKRMYYGGSQGIYGKRRCIRTRIKTK